MTHVSANWGAMESRNGECVRDPTVGVDHVARHSAVIYAGDRVTLKRDGGEFCIILLVDGVELWAALTDEIVGRDNDTANEE